MMKLLGLIVISIFTFSALAQSETPSEKRLPNFKKTITAPRLGQLRLDYEYDEDNEPVSQPGSFKIYLKCDGAKEALVEDVRGCDLLTHAYDKVERKLTMEMMFAVIDNSSVARCIRKEPREFDLAKFCQEQMNKLLAKPKKPLKK